MGDFLYLKRVERVAPQDRGRVTLVLECGHQVTTEMLDQHKDKPELLVGTHRECRTCDRKRWERAA